MEGKNVRVENGLAGKDIVVYGGATLIRRILDHLGLSPPEKPPSHVPEILRVPVDDEGREIWANPA